MPLAVALRSQVSVCFCDAVSSLFLARARVELSMAHRNAIPAALMNH
jgi:hypothetical protein